MIRSLQPGLTRDLALRTLSPPWPFGLLRRWTKGKVLGMAEIYIPYRLYKVNIECRGKRSNRFLAVDATSGTLDPYEFSDDNLQGRCIDVETRNCLPVRLIEAKTHTLALEQVRRLLFSKGVFLSGTPTITAETTGAEFYVPYWAGFFGQEHNVTVLMLNAIRGTIEGNKIAGLVKAWLMEHPDDRLAAARVSS